MGIISGSRVFIKKTDKVLHTKGTSIPDEDGMNFTVDENIMNESNILQILSLNQPIDDSIVKYIDFFQNANYYFLVLEYVENCMTLKHFITKSHQYIFEKQLSVKEYQSKIKYIFWHLMRTMDWLHNDMLCCHLTLSAKNVLIENVQFRAGSDGKMHINDDIKVKLCGFGSSEIFVNNAFKCMKSGYTLCPLNDCSEMYLAPNVRDMTGWYDPRAADMWSVGIIFYEALTGKKPFTFIPFDIDDPDICHQAGYDAIYGEKLRQHLADCDLLNFSQKENALTLLVGLLRIDETNRFDAKKTLKSNYFKRHNVASAIVIILNCIFVFLSIMYILKY